MQCNHARPFVVVVHSVNRNVSTNGTQVVVLKVLQSEVSTADDELERRTLTSATGMTCNYIAVPRSEIVNRSDLCISQKRGISQRRINSLAQLLDVHRSRTRD